MMALNLKQISNYFHFIKMSRIFELRAESRPIPSVMINWSVSHFLYLISVLRIRNKSFESGSCLKLDSDFFLYNFYTAGEHKVQQVPRVPQCLSPHRNWDPPPPSNAASVFPPPFVWGGAVSFGSGFKSESRFESGIRIRIQILNLDPDLKLVKTFLY